MNEFLAFAQTYGLPSAVAGVVSVLLYRRLDRIIVELTADLKHERGLNDDLTQKGYEALGAVRDLTTELKEQRTQQNESFRLLNDIGRRLDRMEPHR